MERRLAGETEVLGENLPQRHFTYGAALDFTWYNYYLGPSLCSFLRVFHTQNVAEESVRRLQTGCY
jgi:hypothetical protein